MAEQKYYTLLTKVGKASIANATALGNKVDLVKLQLGDGAGAEYNPTEEQSELKRVVWEGSVNNVKIDEENPNWVVIETVIPGSVGGFMIREVGIFDSLNQLIAVSKYPETYKPTADSGSVKDLVIKIILVVSNTSSVNLKVDPTVILATLKDIQDLDTKIDTTKTELTTNIETTKTDLDAKIGDTTLLETTDKTNIVGAINEVKTSVDSIETTAEKTSIKDTDNLFESDNVEGALKEVFQNGVNAKNNVVTALNSKGADVTTSDTWEEIKNKIDKKEGRLDLRETKLSGYNPYLVTNGSLKNLDKYSGNLKAFECEKPYFYVIVNTHLIKINAIDESVAFDITLASANFSCICITQEYLFISDNTKLYKINKTTGREIQSIEGAYYKLCTYDDYIYGIYGDETSSTLHKIRISDMYIVLTKNLVSNSIYNFTGGKFVCNKNGIYATTEHSSSSSSTRTDCYLTKINFDFTIAKNFRIGGYLSEKNIKFLNDFVFVSDKYTGIEVDSSNKSNLVKYDANLNLIISNGNSYCTNFDIYNGYIYVINPNSSDPFQKKDLNTFETIKSYRVLYDASPRENMIIINNLIFFINYNIYRNVLSKKVYSDEKGEEL